MKDLELNTNYKSGKPEELLDLVTKFLLIWDCTLDLSKKMERGFLYNMVRIMVGTLVEVGLGKLKAEAIPEILKSEIRENAGYTMPPQGLTLLNVEY